MNHVSFFDKKFIGSILQEEIDSYSLLDGCSKGDTVAGTIVQNIKVQTTSGSNVHLFCKTLPSLDHERIRDMLTWKVFPIEITFYSVLIPLLKKHLNDRAAGHIGATLELPFAHFYTGFSNNIDDYLIIEDVRPCDYVMPSKHTSLKVQEMSLIMSELARFHATTFSLIKYEGESIFDRVKMMNLFKSWDDNFNQPSNMKLYKNQTIGTFEAFKRVIRKRDAELADQMEKIGDHDQIFELIMKPYRSTDSKYFPCIIHGDLWVNNIMLKYDKNDCPIAVKFIDFQESRRGNIFEDILCLFTTSTTVQFRTNHLSEILQIYYESFTDRLKVLGTPLPSNFTIEIMMESYKEMMLPGLIFIGGAFPCQFGYEEKEKEKIDVITIEPEPAKIQNPDLDLDKFNMDEFIQSYIDMTVSNPIAYDRMEESVRELVGLKLI